MTTTKLYRKLNPLTRLSGVLQAVPERVKDQSIKSSCPGQIEITRTVDGRIALQTADATITT